MNTDVKALACVLHSLETGSRAVNPDQYQVVASLLGRALSQARLNDDLCAVFTSYPSTIALYENQHYQNSGLCLQEPEDAAWSDQLTRTYLTSLQSRLAKATS